MPKKIDYPKASLNNCLELAKSVDQLGGMSSIDTCAENMNKKVSGAFRAIVSTSSKFGFTTFKAGQLQITTLYRNYKLAYNEAEKAAALQEAFLNIPVFKEVYEKFKKVVLPIKMLDKILAREYGVDDKISSRVSKYFLEGARVSRLLKNDFTFEGNPVVVEQLDESFEGKNDKTNDERLSKPDIKSAPNSTTNLNFTVNIVGPGIDSSIEINEEEDFIILDAMLNKIKKRFDNKDE